MTVRQRSKTTPAKRPAKGLPPSYEQFQVPAEAVFTIIENYSSKADAERAARALTAGKPVVVAGTVDALHTKVLRQAAARLAASAQAMTDAAAALMAAFEPSSRARAILKGREIAIEDLKQSGGTYTQAQVCQLLHDISRQRIDQLVKSGRLLAVPGPSHIRRYPVVQFKDDGTLIDGLNEVQQALPTQNPWAVLNFLLHGDDRLQGRTPIDVLRGGDVAAVVAAAKYAGEPGA